MLVSTVTRVPSSGFTLRVLLPRRGSSCPSGGVDSEHANASRSFAQAAATVFGMRGTSVQKDSTARVDELAHYAWAFGGVELCIRFIGQGRDASPPQSLAAAAREHLGDDDLSRIVCKEVKVLELYTAKAKHSARARRSAVESSGPEYHDIPTRLLPRCAKLRG